MDIAFQATYIFAMTEENQENNSHSNIYKRLMPLFLLYIIIISYYVIKVNYILIINELVVYFQSKVEF